MKKQLHKILLTLGLFFSLLSSAQIELIPNTLNPQIESSSLARRSIDTLSLPFSDNFIDFSIKDHWIENRGAFVNNTMAQNMPNVGVLTFDAVDGTGEAYQFVDFISEIDGLGDQITSCPIDLGGSLPADGVAMRFFFQHGSPYNENQTPEFEDGDALRLQFLDNDENWETVWPVGDDLANIIALDYASDTFLLQNILLESEFLHEAFQFRFQYNGVLSGDWDLVSIDDIYIDSGVAVLGSDTTFIRPTDYGISETPGSLLKDYVTMPYTHFLNADESVLVDSVKGSVYSLNNLFIADQAESFRLGYREHEIYSSSSQSFSSGFTSEEKRLIDVYWEIDKEVVKDELDRVFFYGDVDLRTTIELNTPDTVATTDSASSYFHFSDFYARDDGTIEAGGGFIGPGEMVMAFDILEDDVISGLQVYFPKVGADFEGTFITFKLYSALEGVDGSSTSDVVYEQNDVVSYSEDSITLNQFVSISFSESVSVSAGRYYLGYESLTKTKVLLGVDLNNDHSDKIFFRLFDDPWSSADIAGALAIRPVVGSLQVGLDDDVTSGVINVFPNPVQRYAVLSKEVEEFKVFNLSGGLVLEGEPVQNEIALYSLPSGVYILEVWQEGELLRTKFAKQ